MDFYAKYELNILEVSVDEKEAIIDDLRSEDDTLFWAIDAYGHPQDTVKWYEHEKDLILISEKYSKYLFQLDVLTEENVYIKKYFKAGKKLTI